MLAEAGVVANGHDCRRRCRSLRRPEFARATHGSIPHEFEETMLRLRLKMSYDWTSAFSGHLDSVAPYATPREH